jgi:hypothetical protein
VIASRIKAAASLKDANRLPLLAVLSVNLVVFILIVQTDSILAAGAAARSVTIGSPSCRQDWVYSLRALRPSSSPRIGRPA